MKIIAWIWSFISVIIFAAFMCLQCREIRKNYMHKSSKNESILLAIPENTVPKIVMSLPLLVCQNVLTGICTY